MLKHCSRGAATNVDDRLKGLFRCSVLFSVVDPCLPFTFTLLRG